MKYAFPLFLLTILPPANANSLLVPGSGELKPLTIQEALGAVQPGEVVIVSEYHSYPIHHEHQVMVLEALAPKLPKISLGMELFSFPQQRAVDAFVNDQVTEDTFLANIGWNQDSVDFGFYRRQVLFPKEHLGRTIAINSPRFLTRKIRQEGLERLTEDEKGLLPPNFELGNALYKERVKEAAQNHIKDPLALERYFAAQSAWDDTMAFITCEFLKKYPDQVLVVLVGATHADYGGGLPDRMKKRGCKKVTTISQTAVTDLQHPGLADFLKPDPRYGQLGDYIWLSDDPVPTMNEEDLL